MAWARRARVWELVRLVRLPRQVQGRGGRTWSTAKYFGGPGDRPAAAAPRSPTWTRARLLPPSLYPSPPASSPISHRPPPSCHLPPPTPTACVVPPSPSRPAAPAAVAVMKSTCLDAAAAGASRWALTWPPPPPTCWRRRPAFGVAARHPPAPLTHPVPTAQPPRVPPLQRPRWEPPTAAPGGRPDGGGGSPSCPRHRERQPCRAPTAGCSCGGGRRR